MSTICEWHLCPELVKKDNRFCSKKCRLKFQVDQRRKDIKSISVKYKGGKCYICHYSSCLNALEFHHLDSSEKEFAISVNGHTRSWSATKAELDKCVLLCCRCHREYHAGEHSAILSEYYQELKAGMHIYELSPIDTNRQKFSKQQNMLKRQRICVRCNQTFDPGKTQKTICSMECKRKTEKPKPGRYMKVKNRPSTEELREMLKTMSYCAIGRKYGVTDNAVRKWEK